MPILPQQKTETRTQGEWNLHSFQHNGCRNPLEKIKAISDYPLLIGELLRRAAVRQQKRKKWDRFLRRLSGGKLFVIAADTCLHLNPDNAVIADAAGNEARAKLSL